MEMTTDTLQAAAAAQGAPHSASDCRKNGLAVRDALDVLQGKWRLPILATLRGQELRFNDFLREMPKITPKVLTTELRYLEQNDLLVRRTHPGHPPRVTYALSDYGHTLGKVLAALSEWGTLHRNRMMGRSH